MGLLDRLKEGADQAMGLAGQAVDRARDEAKDLNLKRQLGSAQEDLGRITFELVEEGAVSHPKLTPAVERIRALREESAAVNAGRTAETVEEKQAAPSSAGSQPDPTGDREADA
jgi:hypothetical protein